MSYTFGMKDYSGLIIEVKIPSEVSLKEAEKIARNIMASAELIDADEGCWLIEKEEK